MWRCPFCHWPHYTAEKFPNSGVWACACGALITFRRAKEFTSDSENPNKVHLYTEPIDDSDDDDDDLWGDDDRTVSSLSEEIAAAIENCISGGVKYPGTHTDDVRKEDSWRERIGRGEGTTQDYIEAMSDPTWISTIDKMSLKEVAAHAARVDAAIMQGTDRTQSDTDEKEPPAPLLAS